MPSTDTRAALMKQITEELYDLKYGETNLHGYAERIVNLVLARSAPEERGEGADPTAWLAEENRHLKFAGDALAVAALRVTTEYDGVHRLRLAVADWSKATADEDGRALASPPAPAQEPEELRSCNADGCGWIGLRSECRRLGDIGPLCPDCGETTEVEPSAPPVAQGAEEIRPRCGMCAAAIPLADLAAGRGMLGGASFICADCADTSEGWDYVQSTVTAAPQGLPREEERRACPVCGGRGNVALGFYGDRISGNSTSAVNLETCRTCNGTTVYPPACPVAGSEAHGQLGGAQNPPEILGGGSEERERIAQMFEAYAENVAGVFRRAVETATAKIRDEEVDAVRTLEAALASEVEAVNEMEADILTALRGEEVQGG